MATYRVFTVFDLNNIGDGGTPPNGTEFTTVNGQVALSGPGNQTPTDPVPPFSLIVADNDGDLELNGDRNAGDVSDDQDQVVFVVDDLGNITANPDILYLELTYDIFEADGVTDTGFDAYELETEDGNLSLFIIDANNLPDATYVLENRDTTPGANAAEDHVDYASLLVGDEGISTDLFTNFPEDAKNADTLIGSDGADTLDGEFFSDLVQGGLGDDLLRGGFGQDTLEGGEGNDTIEGDNGLTVVDRQSLKWSEVPDPDGDGTAIDDNDPINNGNIDTGFITVGFNTTVQGGSATTEFDTTTINTVGITDDGNGVDANSALQLASTVATTGDIAEVELTFTPNDTALDERVENVSFNITDIDSSTFTDQVTITAFNGVDQVAVTLTPGGTQNATDGVILSDEDAGNADDDTATSRTTAGNQPADDPEQTITVDIAGPVDRIVIDYNNVGGNATQIIHISDIYFDAVVTEDSAFADVIDGGAGDDSVIAGEGDDTITLADNDTITGGDGADTFVVTDQAASNAVITDFDTATGIENSDDPADQTNNDFADLSGFFANQRELRDANLNAEGQNVLLDLGDGQTLEFQGVTSTNELTFENTNVVCFTRDTMIATPEGERPIQSLKVGDLVTTADGEAKPLRWIGARLAPALGPLAPVTIRAGALGNDRDLRVSPLHRMLVSGWRAEMLFGEREVLVAAKHLLNGDTIFVAEGGQVEYFHMLFDDHEIVFANGAASESLHPGAENLDGFGEAAREEIFALFPELRDDPTAYGAAARTSLRAFEARVLAENPTFMAN